MLRKRKAPDRVRRFLEFCNEENLRRLRESRKWARRRRDQAMREDRDRCNYLRWKMDKGY